MTSEIREQSRTRLLVVIQAGAVVSEGEASVVVGAGAVGVVGPSEADGATLTTNRLLTPRTRVDIGLIRWRVTGVPLLRICPC